MSLFSAACVASLNAEFFTADFFNRIAQQYGQNKIDDFKDWQSLIEDAEGLDDYSKLNLANQFANRHIKYQTDTQHWDKSDYWATPIESLGSGAGDCEDYAIFKYFTLKAMGVDESKMRLMYVRALTIDEPHMVLIYFETPRDIPLVLDNYQTKIKPASQRKDLKPIYSFNGQGLWLAKARGLGNTKPNSSGTKDWTNLMTRIEQGQ
ncbi:transglutaminase-like cysteine peptidase [Shewanella gaetbuli]|uniref:Transglutaminase-like cysteine peptidase n=1 Tax=Shewanella gaetbuli TaxID=220752 RepID=A0A9X1ZPJ0_9GAMM|nr:transglutaminase-like cysteine peptidase [Shewanella gaetbuli]MCL1143257.1 transglutaminase-like cysteine peptidase [Shewanella gaetbuli]